MASAGTARPGGMSVPRRPRKAPQAAPAASTDRSRVPSGVPARWSGLTMAALRRWANAHDLDVTGIDRKTDLVAWLTRKTGSETVPDP